jgi:membrane protease YdiL (CAAX protease family)
VPLGAAGGWLVTRLDRTIARDLNRRRMRRDAAARGRRGAQRRAEAAMRVVAHAAGQRREGRDEQGARTVSAALAAGRGALGAMVAIAVLEEILYRGLLLQLVALSPSPALRALGAAFVVIMFCLSHVWFGWAQVAAKLPLSVGATAAVLLTGSVLPAIVAHVVLNVMAWRHLDARALVERQPGWAR